MANSSEGVLRRSTYLRKCWRKRFWGVFGGLELILGGFWGFGVDFGGLEFGGFCGGLEFGGFCGGLEFGGFLVVWSLGGFCGGLEFGGFCGGLELILGGFWGFEIFEKVFINFWVFLVDFPVF